MYTFQKQQNKIVSVNNSDLLQFLRENKSPTYLYRCILTFIQKKKEGINRI